MNLETWRELRLFFSRFFHQIEKHIKIFVFLPRKSNALLSCKDTGHFLVAFFNHHVMTKRVTFYIDGFNFYFGIKRARSIDRNWGNCYWIDVVKLCESFLGEDQILEKVVYFTASPMNPA